MSSNLRETAVCRERYRKGGMRTTLKTIRIWTWSTLTFTTRTKILTGTRPRKKVVMCMLLLTPPQSNHLVSMIKLQWAHASIISVVNLIRYWKRSVRASRRVIKSSKRRGSYACISTDEDDYSLTRACRRPVDDPIYREMLRANRYLFV